MNTIPRRARLDLNTPTELLISEAANEVEKLGADPKLTMALIKLFEAKDLLSDYVDENLQTIESDKTRIFKLIEKNSLKIEESSKNGIIAHHVEVEDLVDDFLAFCGNDTRLNFPKKDVEYLQCSKCGRKTWRLGEVNNNCSMTQPSGKKCEGTFVAK